MGLPQARFSCCVEMEEGAWSRTGADAAEFLLAANPGEAMRPVKAAASGGELSRVMLALKTSFAIRTHLCRINQLYLFLNDREYPS